MKGPHDPTDSAGSSGAHGGAQLLVVSGCSGAGKTTVVECLLGDPLFARARTATTRPPRDGEHNREDYDFLSEEAFRAGLARGDFVEHAEVYGHWYGTPRGNLEEVLSSGRHCVLVVDVQGARTLREIGLDAIFVFLRAPSPEVLRRRLESRRKDSPEVIARRLEEARRERAETEHFDLVLTNDDVEETARRLAAQAGVDWTPQTAEE